MVAVCETMSALNETMNEPRSPHVGTAGHLTRALWKCLHYRYHQDFWVESGPPLLLKFQISGFETNHNLVNGDSAIYLSYS